MSEVCTIGLDIAKEKFQVHGEDQFLHQIFNKQLLRKNLIPFFANLPPCLVGIEACAGAHFWGRELTKLGHDVHLIPTRQVKPFVVNNKTDAADARAICEVVRRPTTTNVRIKTIDQQQLMALHKIRERRIAERTSLTNQIRSILLEVGITINQGIPYIKRDIPLLIDPDDNRLNILYKDILSDLYDELIKIDEKIKSVETKLIQIAKSEDNCVRLMKIPGVGYLTATAIFAHMGTAKEFKNGRSFAACLGLTPREYSSGGKQKLLGISKRGNPYIRKLLIQGARSIFYIWNKKEIGNDYRISWIKSLCVRRGNFRAIVAQANKTARIIWNVLSKGIDYIPCHSI